MLNRRWMTRDQLDAIHADVINTYANTRLSTSRSKLKSPADFLPAGYVYDPRIDIDNDGYADNVVMFSDEDRKSLLCGYPDARRGYPMLGGVLGAIVDEKFKLDAAKTLAVFSSTDIPSGITLPSIAVNTSYGAFEYRGVFYFDAFKDTRSALSSNVLRVYLKREGQAHMICEYSVNLGSQR